MYKLIGTDNKYERLVKYISKHYKTPNLIFVGFVVVVVVVFSSLGLIMWGVASA